MRKEVVVGTVLFVIVVLLIYYRMRKKAAEKEMVQRGCKVPTEVNRRVKEEILTYILSVVPGESFGPEQIERRAELSRLYNEYMTRYDDIVRIYFRFVNEHIYDIYNRAEIMKRYLYHRLETAIEGRPVDWDGWMDDMAKTIVKTRATLQQPDLTVVEELTGFSLDVLEVEIKKPVEDLGNLVGNVDTLMRPPSADNAFKGIQEVSLLLPFAVRHIIGKALNYYLSVQDHDYSDNDKAIIDAVVNKHANRMYSFLYNTVLGAGTFDPILKGRLNDKTYSALRKHMSEKTPLPTDIFGLSNLHRLEHGLFDQLMGYVFTRDAEHNLKSAIPAPCIDDSGHVYIRCPGEYTDKKGVTERTYIVIEKDILVELSNVYTNQSMMIFDAQTLFEQINDVIILENSPVWARTDFPLLQTHTCEFLLGVFSVDKMTTYPEYMVQGRPYRNKAYRIEKGKHQVSREFIQDHFSANLNYKMILLAHNLRQLVNVLTGLSIGGDFRRAVEIGSKIDKVFAIESGMVEAVFYAYLDIAETVNKGIATELSDPKYRLEAGEINATRILKSEVRDKDGPLQESIKTFETYLQSFKDGDEMLRPLFTLYSLHTIHDLIYTKLDLFVDKYCDRGGEFNDSTFEQDVKELSIESVTSLGWQSAMLLLERTITSASDMYVDKKKRRQTLKEMIDMGASRVKLEYLQKNSKGLIGYYSDLYGEDLRKYMGPVRAFRNATVANVRKSRFANRKK